MIINPIQFSNTAQEHIATFDGTAEHWDGRCHRRTSLRREIREHYLAEQGYHCPYCNRLRQDNHGYNWDVDHIIPKSTHPHFLYEPKNLSVTCKDCNGAKDNDDVLTPGTDASRNYPMNSDDYIIIHPHIDVYQHHMITSHNDKGQVYHTPTTEKGIETFRICGLLRFTEEIANTSEIIENNDNTLRIGFSDEVFEDLYIGYQTITSNYGQNDPEERAELLTRFLARELSIPHIDLTNLINGLRDISLRDVNTDQDVLTQQPLLPPPET